MESVLKKVKATALLLTVWLEELPQDSEANAYRTHLAKFVKHQTDQPFALEIMRTNVLFDHRAYFLMKLASSDPAFGGSTEDPSKSEKFASIAALGLSLQEIQRAIFVYTCTMYRTYMEELAPSSFNNKNTKAWATYWKSKVDEAIQKRVGPIWELL